MVWYGVAGRVYSYVKMFHNKRNGFVKMSKAAKIKTDSGSRTRIRQTLLVLPGMTS